MHKLTLRCLLPTLVPHPVRSQAHPQPAFQLSTEFQVTLLPPLHSKSQAATFLTPSYKQTSGLFHGKVSYLPQYFCFSNIPKTV